jgi:hypothetical protein
MKNLKVDPKSLTFSEWNANHVSPDNQAKLQESIRRNGIFRPIIVRETASGDLEIIAGEHTTKAAIALGYTEIDVYNLGAISDAKAKEIAVVDNRHYGIEDAGELAILLKDFDDGELRDFMPFSEEELTSIFSTSEKIDLDNLGFEDDNSTPQSKNDEAMSKAPVTHQTMRFRVPMADAEFVTRCIEAICRRQGFDSADSLTNVGDALVYLCKESK